MIGVFVSIALLVIVARFYDFDHDRMVGFLAIWGALMVIRLQWRVDDLERKIRHGDETSQRPGFLRRLVESDTRSA